MRSCFRYPGAKAKLLPQIMPFIDTSLKSKTKFCDAFVGGGSVLLAVALRYPNIELSCNDKDWLVYCFWKIMASGNKDEIDSLKQKILVKPTIELFYKLRLEAPQNEVEAAYRSLFFNRTSFSGDMRHQKSSPIGGKNQSSVYSIDCRYNAKKLVQQVDAIHKLLYGRVEVSNADINQYIDTLATDTTIYLDPPYVKAGKMLYHEFMKEKEHKDLSDKLKVKSNWILSYDNCKEVLDLYNWASIHFIDAKYCIRGAKETWHKTKEVLIVPS